MKTSKPKSNKQPQIDTTVHAAILHPTFEQIQQRAFEIFQACGCVSGRELDDWLLAEKELNAELELQFRVQQEMKGDLEE